MNLGGADLNLLVVFDALMTERSVTRAARRLGLSQSATSHALGRLRTWLADPLFTRAGQGIVPTPRALELRAPVADALARLVGALGTPEAFDPATAEGVVRIGAIDLAQVLLVPRLAARVAVEAPRAQIVVVPYPEAAQRALSEGEVDLVVGLSRPTPDLHERALGVQRFRCVVRRGHPALAEGLTVERYAALPHALVTPRGVPRGFVDRALAERGLSRRVVLTVPHFLVAALAVSRSDLVLTVAEDVAAAAADVLPVEVIEPPLAIEPFRVALTWHERCDADPLQRWVRDAIGEGAADRRASA